MPTGNYRVIVIHGIFASPRSDWFPGFTRIMKRRGIDVSVPVLPGPLFNWLPDAAGWQRAIDREMRCSGKTPVLVGFSLGCRALLEYVETHPVRIPAMVLVSPPPHDTSYADRGFGIVRGFFGHPVDTRLVRSRVKKITVVHSADDPKVPYAGALALARELNATFVPYRGWGHCSNPSFAPEAAGLVLAAIESRERKRYNAPIRNLIDHVL